LKIFARRMFPYAKPYIAKAVLSAFLAIVVSAGNFSPVYFVKIIIDKVLVKNTGRAFLPLVCIGLIAMIIIKGLVYYGQIYLASIISNGIVRDIRQDLFDRLINYSMVFYHKNPTGQIMSRFLNDISILQNSIQSMVSLASDSFLVIFLLLWNMSRDFKFALATILVLPPISFVIKIFSKKIRRLSYRLQTRIGDISSFLQESFNGIREIKTFVLEKKRKEDFWNINHDNYIISNKNMRINGTVLPIIEFFNVLALSGVLYYGGLLVINGSMTKGDLFSFITALGIMFTPIKRITNVNNYLQQAVGASYRIFEYIDSPYIENPMGDGIISPINGNINIKELDFSYEAGNTVLKNISINIKSGEKLAIVGKSGSGKTTLVNLLPLFYKAPENKIFIDNIPIEKYSLSFLRENIGIVPQETFIFKGKVKNNISLWGDYSDEEIIEAARAANAHEFIMDLPYGYQTELEERGSNLSGGQRQRIAIARLILKNPKILLLDEATSALDTESEALVHEALDRLMEGKTTIIIAHRLSTIKNADRIAVIKDGTIIELGNHQELIKSKGEYFNLYQTQFANAKYNGDYHE